mgnify:CR=1 FL=1
MSGTALPQVLLGFIVLLFSFTVHELAHAWVANRLGDPTGRLLGRITLNPMAHADLFGTVLLPLIGLLGGGLVVGWAKPVPVNPINYRRYRAGDIRVSLAGIVDLTLATQQVIGRTYDPLPMYLLAAAMYFAINYALSVASRRLEARFAYIRE